MLKKTTYRAPHSTHSEPLVDVRVVLVLRVHHYALQRKVAREALEHLDDRLQLVDVQLQLAACVQPIRVDLQRQIIPLLKRTRDEHVTHMAWLPLVETQSQRA